MQRWLRRIRGSIGIGLTWAAAWGVAGMVPRWVFGFNTDVPFPLVFGVLGFVAGVIFAGVLMLTERRREFDQMKISRFAAWGGISGFLLSAVFARAASLGAGDVFVIAPLFAVAGAICASGSLALARRAKTLELSEADRGAAQGRFADREKRKALLGGD